MNLFATGNTLSPGLPARTGDAACDGEKAKGSAVFEAFLGLALTIPSPDATFDSGPEGKGGDELPDIAQAPDGNTASLTGNILPVVLPGTDQATEDQPCLPVQIATSRSRSETLASSGPHALLRADQAVGSGGLEPALTPEHPIAGTSVATSKIDTAIGTKIPDAASYAEALARGQVASSRQNLRVPNPVALSQGDLSDAVTRTGLPIATILAGRDGAAGAATVTAELPENNGGVTNAAIARTGPPTPQVILTLPDTAKPAHQSGGHDIAFGAPLPSPQQNTTTGEALAAQDAPEFESPRKLDLAAGEFASSITPAMASVTEPIILPGETVPASRPQLSVTATNDKSVAATAIDAHDFAGIVDRLARARESGETDVVRTAMTTREFGTVAMQMRPGEGRLHVALTSADPGFATAVQAASATSSTGQQASQDASAQQQQSHGQSASPHGQGQAMPEGQSRQQTSSRFIDAGRTSENHPGNGEDAPASAPRGDEGSAIYA